MLQTNKKPTPSPQNSGVSHSPYFLYRNFAHSNFLQGKWGKEEETPSNRMGNKSLYLCPQVPWRSWLSCSSYPDYCPMKRRDGRKNTNMKTNTLNNLNLDLILESPDLLEEGLQGHEGVGFGVLESEVGMSVRFLVCLPPFIPCAGGWEGWGGPGALQLPLSHLNKKELFFLEGARSVNAILNKRWGILKTILNYPD